MTPATSQEHHLVFSKCGDFESALERLRREGVPSSHPPHQLQGRATYPGQHRCSSSYLSAAAWSVLPACKEGEGMGTCPH
jgi:hypothetical protein